MPNKSLKCETFVKINMISCPGVWLHCRNDVFFKICMFGKEHQTRLITAVFPLIIYEKFHFEKAFPDCSDPAELANALQDEWVFLELVQVSNYRSRGILLAAYEGSIREFLFPLPIIRPKYTGSERELLLVASPQFPGILAPKLEFSTSTVIKEFRMPSDLKKKLLKFEQQLAAKSHSVTGQQASKCTSYPPPKYTEHESTSRPCTICELYKKYFRREYLGHHHAHFSPSTQSHHLSRSSPAIYGSLQNQGANNNSIDYAYTPEITYTKPEGTKRYISRNLTDNTKQTDFNYLSPARLNQYQSKSLTDLTEIEPSSYQYRPSSHTDYSRRDLNERLERLYANLYNQVKWRERYLK